MKIERGREGREREIPEERALMMTIDREKETYREKEPRR